MSTTTYTLKESNAGTLLLFASDAGKVGYCELFEGSTASEDAGNCLADLLAGATAAEMDNNTYSFFCEEEAASLIAEAETWPTIADEAGTYPQKADPAGILALEFATWPTDYTDYIQNCSLFDELTRLINRHSSVDIESGKDEAIFQEAFIQAVNILCDSEADLWAEFSDCITECGKSLRLLRSFEIRHYFDTEDGERTECTEAEAEYRECAIEFYSRGQQSERTADMILFNLPEDPAANAGPEYESDDCQIWYTWNIKK